MCLALAKVLKGVEHVFIYGPKDIILDLGNHFEIRVFERLD